MDNTHHSRYRKIARSLVFCHLIIGLWIAMPKTHAQSELPILKANSPNVQILDDDHPSKGDWVLDPTIELDTYHAIRSDKERTIVFKTDLESRSFEVQPGHVYDFVILLNEKHNCKHRISTMAQGFQRLGGDTSKPVTIPITIEHGKLHLKGRVNGSAMLDLIFDTGADCCAIYPSARDNGVNLTFDESVLNAGSGGVTRRQLSSDNQLEIADAKWQHERFIFVEKQADRADGIVGYTVFENRIVEIDYDRMLLLVHESLPVHIAEFSKTAMPFAGSLPAVDVQVLNGHVSFGGPFILDTAGTGCMLVNQAFAADHQMHRSLKKVGTGVSTGVGSGSIHSSLLMAPTLSIGGHSLNNVPINVELPSDGNKAPPGGVICMDVLSRFNTVLDFPASTAYFKPNAGFSQPFRIRGRVQFVWVMTAIVGTVVVAMVAVRLRTRLRTRVQRIV